MDEFQICERCGTSYPKTKEYWSTTQSKLRKKTNDVVTYYAKICNQCRREKSEKSEKSYIKTIERPKYIPPQHSYCLGCKMIKHDEEFYTRINAKGEIVCASRCKKCMSAYSKKYYPYTAKPKKPKLHIIDDNHQRCKRCGLIKENDEFALYKRVYKDSTYTSRESVCKQCRTDKARENRIKKRELRTPLTEQECVKCAEIKSVDEFECTDRYATGYAKQCKSCHNSREVKYKQRAKALIFYKRMEVHKLIMRQPEDRWEELRKINYKHVKQYLNRSPVKGLQYCIDCDELLSFDCFSKNDTLTGHMYRCKSCESAKRKKSWEANNEYYITKKKEYYHDKENNVRLRIRSRINMAIKAQRTNKKLKSLELLGCTGKFAYEYLCALGYTPEKDHIDHIVPCIRFDLSKEDHQLVCFNYRNLQPLSAIDNIIKHTDLPGNWEDHIKWIGNEIGVDVSSIIRYIKSA